MLKQGLFFSLIVIFIFSACSEDDSAEPLNSIDPGYNWYPSKMELNIHTQTPNSSVMSNTGTRPWFFEYENQRLSSIIKPTYSEDTLFIRVQYNYRNKVSNASIEYGSEIRSLNFNYEKDQLISIISSEFEYTFKYSGDSLLDFIVFNTPSGSIWHNRQFALDKNGNALEIRRSSPFSTNNYDVKLNPLRFIPKELRWLMAFRSALFSTETEFYYFPKTEFFIGSNRITNSKSYSFEEIYQYYDYAEDEITIVNTVKRDKDQVFYYKIK